MLANTGITAAVGTLPVKPTSILLENLAFVGILDWDLCDVWLAEP